MKELYNILKRTLGPNIYNNLRSIYLFGKTDSPFPLYSSPNFEIDWETFRSESSSHIKAAYIVSPTQRSGTNFLNYLLNLHPDIVIPDEDKFPSEQCLYSNIDFLKHYVYETVKLWSKWRNKNGFSLEAQVKYLMHSIGNGILDSLAVGNGVNKTLLLKTPDAGHFEDFFHLFSDVKVIILIRDGRDTVESFSASWGGPHVFRKMTKRWKNRMESIEGFVVRAENSGMSDRFHKTSYEALNENGEEELKKILKFLDLSIDLFPWQELENLPILGSSEFKNGQGEVHWDPLIKSKSFQPSRKWKNWDNGKKRAFKRIAGDLLIRQGFTADDQW